MCGTWTIDQWKRVAAEPTSNYTVIDEFVGPKDERGLVTEESYESIFGDGTQNYFYSVMDGGRIYHLFYSRNGSLEAARKDMADNGYTLSARQPGIAEASVTVAPSGLSQVQTQPVEQIAFDLNTTTADEEAVLATL